MRLFQLAFVCRTYGELTQFDAGYLDFLNKTGGELDFWSPTHMKALLVWLNSWGCRQFAVDYHNQAAESILRWAEKWEPTLPSTSMTLDCLSEEDIQVIGDAYADLSKCLASTQTRGGKRHDVRVGPTGTAKILFAARPKALPPWDEPIRAKFGWDGSPASYCAYLASVREQVRQLCSESAELGVPPEDIPSAIGRPKSTLPKLIDEFNWITITKGFSPPEPNEIARWYRWSGHHAR
jgi:hypothetical protein